MNRLDLDREKKNRFIGSVQHIIFNFCADFRSKRTEMEIYLKSIVNVYCIIVFLLVMLQDSQVT